MPLLLNHGEMSLCYSIGVADHLFVLSFYPSLHISSTPSGYVLPDMQIYQLLGGIYQGAGILKPNIK